MRQVFGKYRLIAELGRGGMGQVFLALTSGMAGTFNKLVVVKQLHSYLADDPEFSRMFFDEARLAARLNHKNVVQTHEAGAEDGVLYLAMEYLEGQPLHRIVERALADFPLEMHLAILIDVLAGLHHAHELKDFDGTPLNVVHRDVSPHNVFVTYDGQIKVVDFGIAAAEGRSTKTRHGLVKGKPMYMAPEQARGEKIDRRADIFAVGIMMFEALTNEPYWGTEKSNEQVRAALITGDLVTVPDDAADPELVAICRKALALDPDDRYATALDMQRALEAFSAAKLARPSSLQIGAEVEDLFRDKRDAMRRAVEKAIANLKVEGIANVQTPTPRVTPGEATPTRIEPRGKSGSSATRDQTPEVATPRTPPSPSPSSPSLKPPPSSARRSEPGPELTTPSIGAMDMTRGETTVPSRRRMPNAVVVGTLLVATAGTLAWLLPSSRPASTTVRVELSASDVDTRFRIDDGPWLTSPWVGAAPRDGREHTITAELTGAPSRNFVVRFDGDVRIVVKR